MIRTVLYIATIFICFAACQQERLDKLSIATAANMQFAMRDICRAFSAQTGIDCQIITASSGKLTAQISEGAPYDILVSADMKYPNDLHRRGLTAAPPASYAFGRLILWSMTSDVEPSLAALKDTALDHIALANPAIAPYGAAALEVLRRCGMYEQVADRLVLGESIAQTNQFIITQAADIGFSAKSVVLAPAMRGKGRWKEIDSSLYSPIVQGVAILRNRTKHAEQAQQFYDYLFADQARSILEQYGYATHRE